MLITMSVSADCRSCWGASGHHRGAGAGMEHHQLISIRYTGDQPGLGGGLHTSSEQVIPSLQPCLIVVIVMLC